MSDDQHDVDEDSGDKLDETGLDALLDFLHRSRGFDFTGYKRTSLTRRIRRRMAVLGMSSFPEYLDHLEVHPDEFPQLFNMLLINVTAFFRDPPAWQAVSARLGTVIDLAGDRPIRVWSAGCSSGEEPYTLAMILCEALGLESFTRRVKIYATDVDEDALVHARQAIYPPKALEGVAPELVEKYFTRSGTSYAFHKDLRRCVIFGRHDLVQDAPIPRVDILCCRNTLMYFNAETQTRILQRLQFALSPTGIFFLGKAEMLLTHADLFSPVDLKLRIFARAMTKSPRSRDRALLDPPKAPATPANNLGNGDESRFQLLRLNFDASPISQIVVDASGRLALANSRAMAEFSLAPSDLGRPFHELELSYRPAELRSCIDNVRLERRALQLKEIERSQRSGDKVSLDIDIQPLLTETGIYLGAQVSFTDVTTAYRLQSRLRQANAELEAAHEELQSTSEELETTNEELQSTVEELETTNEELQSTNEELETMNEELQSTNEELQTINEELRQRGTELNELNAFHSAVLGSLRTGLAVLDRDFQVRAWNAKMEDLWGARWDEVEGKHFLNLDIGLPIDRLTASLRAAVGSGEEAEHTLECTNRRGKATVCRITLMPLRVEPRGVVVVIEEIKS